MFELLVGFIFCISYLLRSIGVITYNGPRRNSSTFMRCRQILLATAEQNGGAVSLGRWRQLRYTPASRKWLLEINCDSRNRLTIRLPNAFPFYASWVRLPRLPYAFLEAFISDQVRAGDARYFVFAPDSTRVAELNRRTGFIPVLKQLSLAGFSIQLGSHGAVLWKTIRYQDLSFEGFQSLIRLAEDFFLLVDPNCSTIAMHPLHSKRRCAYCKEAFNEIVSAIYCTNCGTPHHPDCFALNGRCSVFGCETRIPQIVEQHRLENLG